MSQNVLHADWSFYERAEEFLRQVATLNPDVVALQEYQYGKHSWWEERFALLGFRAATPLVAGWQSGNIIYVKADCDVVFADVALFDGGLGTIPSPLVKVVKGGRGVWVVCNHFVWDARNSHRRLLQVQRLSEYAVSRQGEGEVFVAVGDFNAMPDEDCIRFMKGKTGAGGDGTFWLDAFDSREGEGLDFTQSPVLSWVRATAEARFGVGVNVDVFPSRRIDYIFSHGWQYGRHGFPLSYGLVVGEGIDISDHYGVWSDILL